MQCRDSDLDYVEEKKVEAEELEVEDNPNRGKSSSQYALQIDIILRKWKIDFSQNKLGTLKKYNINF